MTEKKAPTMQDVFAPYAAINTALAEHMAEMGSEVLHFISERVQEDVKTQAALLSCTDLDQLAHVQAEFVQKAIDQYTAETGRLVELSNEMLQEAGLPKID